MAAPKRCRSRSTKRVKRYAVPAHDDEPEKPDADSIKTDPSSFKGVPIGAAKQLAVIKDAIAKRDYASLRPVLADDVTWSLGGGTGADAAMAMWQADPTALDAMLATLGTCVERERQAHRVPGRQPAARHVAARARAARQRLEGRVVRQGRRVAHGFSIAIRQFESGSSTAASRSSVSSILPARPAR